MASAQPSTAAALKRAAATCLRRVLHSTYDQLDRWQGTHDPLIPPRQVNPNMMFTPQRSRYAREFAAGGDRLGQMLVACADLKPSSSVLDIGSGIGRVARSLTTTLSTEGTYRGFDVDPAAVAWCQRAYAGFKNFAFAYAPLSYVNVKGKPQTRAEDFVFPLRGCRRSTLRSPCRCTRYLARPGHPRPLSRGDVARAQAGRHLLNTLFLSDADRCAPSPAARCRRAVRASGGHETRR